MKKQEIVMGYVFTGINGGYFAARWNGWRDLRHLACIYGWKPMGTIAPERSNPEDPWSGSYTGNDEQIVCEEDAQLFA
jgi:hypothetical protein